MMKIMRLRRLVGFGRDQFDCDEVRAYSSDYVDSELADSLRHRFRRHLDGCANCSSFVATLRATVLTLRDVPKHSAPANLRERVEECLEDERRAEPPTTGLISQ